MNTSCQNCKNEYQKTIKGEDLPETIEEVTEEFMKEVIECISCKSGYRITTGELDLYKKLNVPIPSKCPKCRGKRRFDLTNKPFSYKTNCAKCNKEINTMHNLNAGKIIYCEKCYQGEFA